MALGFNYLKVKTRSLLHASIYTLNWNGVRAAIGLAIITALYVKRM